MSRLLFLILFLGFVSCNQQGNGVSGNHNEVDYDTINGPYLYFFTDTLNLGVVKQGEKVNCVFKLENKGKSDLIIFAVHAGCGCTSTEWKPEPIKPGEQSEIKVVFNSAGRSGHQVKSITVKSNAQAEEKKLKFTCDVVNSN